MKSNRLLKRSLLFIPDISGFTKFVNETEIVHGVHIISELLEIIIKSNTLNLKVAEIEGDAVLFYKHTNKKPSIDDIFEQCKKMFVAFHQHIKLYDRDRICNCGSCSSAPQLTLKFIIHYGDVIERNILGHFQLMGADVTTVHKLLKNDILENEYILISENSYAKTPSKKIPNWFNLITESEEYNGVGNVVYQYGNLIQLLKEIPELPQKENVQDDPIQVSLDWKINHSIEETFNLISGLERKHEWANVKAIEFDKNKIERIGSQHECITAAGTFRIKTIQNEKNSDAMIFSEMTEATAIFPTTIQTFTLKKSGLDSCIVYYEARFKKSFFNVYVFKKILLSGLPKAIKNLKRVLDEDVSKTKLKKQ